MFCSNAVSVISISSRLGDRLDCASALLTESTIRGDLEVHRRKVDRNFDFSGQLRRCHAGLSKHPVVQRRIRPISSAIGTNTPGIPVPRVGCRQRTSASHPRNLRFSNVEDRLIAQFDSSLSSALRKSNSSSRRTRAFISIPCSNNRADPAPIRLGLVERHVRAAQQRAEFAPERRASSRCRCSRRARCDCSSIS